MKELKKLLNVISLKSNIINTFLGMILIISVILIYLNPLNKPAILVACAAGGFMNMLSGMKLMKDPVRKTTGMTFLMTGVVLIVLGYIITGYFIK
jgi:hypothetical protein